jgi:hypothetical protein
VYKDVAKSNMHGGYLSQYNTIQKYRLIPFFFGMKSAKRAKSIFLLLSKRSASQFYLLHLTNPTILSLSRLSICPPLSHPPSAHKHYTPHSPTSKYSHSHPNNSRHRDQSLSQPFSLPRVEGRLLRNREVLFWVVG